ncbi:MAG: HAMP domain-containing protein, partial [Spirochaetaceae bacterium]|nr:HAMP domain-containing protein [Spirochaetaceae bacterium]
MKAKKDTGHRGLKSKVLILVVVAALVGGAALEIQSYRTLRNNMNAEVLNTLTTFNTIFNDQIAVKSEDISMAVELILQNELITTAFGQGDRATLERLTVEFFNERLNPEFGIAQFQFHVPPATSFFRAHAPEKFGDDLSSFRHTVTAVNSTRQPVVGLEVGRGGPGIRIVYPVFDGDEHVGSVEFGGSIAGALAAAHNTTSAEYAIAIYEEVFQAARRFDLQETDVVKGDLTFYDYSGDHVRDIVESFDLDKVGEVVTMGDRQMMAKLFPIVDFSGKTVGQVLAIKDITAMRDATTREIIRQSIIVGLILLAFATVLTISVLGILTRHVLKPLRQAATLSGEIARGDLSVVIPEVKSRDEIGTLNASFREMLAFLNDALGQVGEAVDQVNTGSEQVAQASQSLSQGSTEQASSLEEVTASLNEINSQSNQNSETAAEASSVAKGSLQSATNGNEEMQALVSAMGQINNSSDEIS